MKEIKLEWNVLDYDFNKKEIVQKNIFYESFILDLKNKIEMGKIENYSQLASFIDSWAKYKYWSKAEYEILVGNIFDENTNNFKKIDIYYQIKLNFHNIVDYVNEKLEINFERSDLNV